MRKDVPDEFKNSVFVEADVSEGMVLVRGFVPDRTWTKVVADYLDGISCDCADRRACGDLRGAHFRRLLPFTAPGMGPGVLLPPSGPDAPSRS